ncbi:MAG: EF2563 family selenium-dependent molybdenum hydroxylase system protein [Acidobacteria bacterium]|nr:EF2563 family selenium-dependent molybdenum hydroxylase system protein [Acidobacteriota bacterium]
MRILVKGAGEMASAAARRLHLCGFQVIMTELARPLCIRRQVSFAEAVFDGWKRVDEVVAVLANTPEQVEGVLQSRRIPVLIDLEGIAANRWRPDLIVDARMLKQPDNTRITEARVVIGLGPGFSAGVDCHAVVETNRGHDLGRVIYRGSAETDSGVPAPVSGQASSRVIRSPTTGSFKAVRAIGDSVAAGEPVGCIAGIPVAAGITGVVRGLIHDGVEIRQGGKVGDIDPRGDSSYCFKISDKANAIAGGVVEASIYLSREMGLLQWK